MGKMVISICTLFCSIFLTNEKDCSDAYSFADDAYSYSRRASNSNNLEDLHRHARNAINAFEDAMLNANNCGCDDTYYEADSGYRNATKAYNTTNIEDGQYYAKKAKRYADYAMSYAEDCNKRNSIMIKPL